MVEIPQQDWRAYEALTSANDAAWVRGLSTQDRFAIYEDAFNVVWTARRDLGDWERLDRWRWDQKVASRLRMVEAYTELDRIRRERATANHSR